MHRRQVGSVILSDFVARRSRSLVLAAARALVAPSLAATLLAGCGEDAPPTSGLDLGALDRSANPCVDLYQFACGGWIRSHPLTPDAVVVNRFQDPFYAAVPALWAIVEADTLGARSADDPYADQIGSHYASCLKAPSDEASRDHLREIVQAIDAVKTLDDLANQAGAQRALGSGTFFRLDIDVDPADPSRYVLSIDQGGIELSDRAYYLDADQAEVRAAYLDHIRALSTLVLGAPIDADAVLRVETALATAAAPEDERRDPESLFHPMTGAELAALSPSFSWTRFWNASGFGVPARVDVVEPQYMAALEKLLASTPIEDLTAYMRWQLLQDRASEVDQPVLNEDFAFWSRFTGQQAPYPRTWSCFTKTLSALGPAIARPYIARYFDDQTRSIAGESTSDLVRAFAGRIKTAPWLDQTTRAEALAKLDAMRFKIGYPDRWPNYDGLNLAGKSYFDQTTALVAFAHEKARTALGEPVDKTEWPLSPLAVNAAYSPRLNDVTLTALWLSPPFVVAGAPLPRNAGSMATVIGHELTHAFDDSGRHYDATGRLRDWWSADADASFAERAQCIVDQFDRYEPLPGEHVDGAMTVGENMADLGGVTAAYHATFDGRTLEGGDGFDATQIFFLAYAQNYCENARPELVSARLLTDPHAPGKFRVNGPLSNLPEFAAAFHCPAGAPMVREAPCRVW